MIILIYGHKGWIGQQIVSYLDKIYSKNNFKYILGKSRVNNIEDVEKEITEYYPTHVISLIGRTHGNGIQTIDYLEDNLYDNIRDNLFSPMILSILSNKYKYHLTYLGTGCIFEYENLNDILEGKTDYKKFTESDNANFFGSSYSIVKGFTDQLINLNNNVLNLRIRMPITSESNPRNFITKITSYEKICSIPNSMTVLPELLPYVVEMMKNKTTGTINLTNPGLISHNEILEMYKEMVDPSFTWKNFSIEEQRSLLAADRSNNYLDTTKLEELFPKMDNIKDAVRKYLHNYKI